MAATGETYWFSLAGDGSSADHAISIYDNPPGGGDAWIHNVIAHGNISTGGEDKVPMTRYGTVAPEPASLALCCGASALLSRRRRR